MASKDREILDPSVNVINLVGNATKYLEELHKQTESFYNQKLQLAVETSQRERSAESLRIDARWLVDNEAIKVATQTSVKQSEMLANQVAENAETLRDGMAKTAEALAVQLQTITKSLGDRLTVVEQQQYKTAGTSQGGRDMWGWVASGILLIIALIQFWRG